MKGSLTISENPCLLSPLPFYTETMRYLYPKRIYLVTKSSLFFPLSLTYIHNPLIYKKYYYTPDRFPWMYELPLS